MEQLMQDMRELLAIADRLMPKMTTVERLILWRVERNFKELDKLDRVGFLLAMEGELPGIPE